MPPTEMTPKQQWSEQIKNAKSILIITHENPDGDALGSSLALKFGLEKMGKEVTVAASGTVSEVFSFLPSFTSLQRELSAQKDLLIILDESQAKIGNISLKRVSETKLIVVITPKEGFLTPANARIEEGTFNTDLVIVLDCANIERLGSIYDENPNLFYEVPVINVDHHPGNTNFGKVNIVDVTASSTAEILVSLLETLGKDVPGMLDADIATCLLTGLTTDTSSFQNSNTTPKSLTVAAQLVATGGRQQEIIKHIFKTRTLATLRLWGRALSYIKEDKPLKFAWSVLSKADFVAAQASQENAAGLIDELLKTASGMDFVLLLSERNNSVHGNLRSMTPVMDVARIAQHFGGGGHTQAAAFTIENAKLAEKENDIIGQIRTLLSPQAPPKPASQPTNKPREEAKTPDSDLDILEASSSLSLERPATPANPTEDSKRIR
jgi:phosphoesterase RecJ-like protein